MGAAFRKLGIKVPAGVCSYRMMDGAKGAGMMGEGATDMMGGSGASSDVHQRHQGTSGPGADGASAVMDGSTSGMMGGTF